MQPRHWTIIATTAALVATGCTQQEQAEVRAKTRDALAETKATLSEAWTDLKAFTYEKKDEFSATAKSMTSRMDAKLSELRADYSESRASQSRKAAMDELKSSENDYRQKLDALGRATADTWESAKQNVVAAWDRLQASYEKAKASND